MPPKPPKEIGNGALGCMVYIHQASVPKPLQGSLCVAQLSCLEAEDVSKFKKHLAPDALAKSGKADMLA